MSKEAKLLNRTIRWTPQGISWEHDQRHVSEVVRTLGLEKANSINTPGTDADPSKSNSPTPDGEDELGKEEATMFRAVAARLNYLSQDRPDIKFATLNVCSDMSRPTVRSLAKLKRIGRYLLGRPRSVQLFRWQPLPTTLDVFSDSDWAGDRKTRKSTSAGCVMMGGHALKSWSKRQQVIALSSAEAELYAATRAASEAIGMASMLHELGHDVKINLLIDSTSAIALAHRDGLGRAKHIAIQDLWLQDTVRRKQVFVVKVHTEENLADLGTKHMTREKTEYFMKRMDHELG